MKHLKVEGIVIKRINVGEADRIITVFTKQLGKMQIKATGVRRISSRRSSHVEFLNHSLLTLYKARSLPVLTEVVTIESSQNIKQDLTKIGYAYYLCELLDGLCPEGQEHGDIFDLFKESLHELANGKNPSRVIDEFEKSLLFMLGFSTRQFMQDSMDTSLFIESLLERKLKTKQILPRLF